MIMMYCNFLYPYTVVTKCLPMVGGAGLFRRDKKWCW